jgi:mono/diheme cytochrome c family protein
MAHRTTVRFLTTLGMGAALLALAAGGLGGCRGDRSENRPRQFLPDMDDSPKFKPQTAAGFFEDGRAMRQPVVGTVPFGATPDAKDPTRADYLKDDPSFYFGKVSQAQDAAFVDNIPSSVVVTQELLARGMERYNIFCASCHGYDGKGGGTVGSQWSYALPNFHDVKYKDRKQPTAKDGYIYHTIRNGVANPDGSLKMPAYGYSINAKDAWAIVAYFRALQNVYAGNINDLPEAERTRLNGLRQGMIEEQKRREAEAAALANPTPAGNPAPSKEAK